MKPVDPNRPFEVKTDTSGDTTGTILLQRDNKGHLYLIVCLTYKFSDTERHYPIYNKELIAIVLIYRT